MPTGSVAEIARLWCECEPIDVFVAFFVELPHEFIEDAALDVMRFFGHHRTVQKNNLRIGIGIADGLQEIAVGPFVETCIVVVGREVVGAEIDANDLWYPLCEVPFLKVAAVNGVVKLVLHGDFVSAFRTVVVAINSYSASGNGCV